jgi:DNA-binding TFAR19-related protein (PDSD5 family)
MASVRTPKLSPMTKLLERALEAVRRLPPDSQDEIARAMLQLAASGGEPEEIDAAHLAAVLEGLAQARRRQVADDAEVEAAFRRFDR